MSADILIVDDERDIRDLIGGILTDENYAPRLAHDSESAFAQIRQRQPSLILLDIWLQGSAMDGLEILSVLQEKYPEIPVIMISGHGNIETAVTAIRSGAFDYIEKPFKMDKLLLTVRHAIESRRLRREVRDLKRKAGITERLIGSSAVIEKLNLAIEKVSSSNGRIMMIGPRGSGKELAARAIHNRSNRARQPFVMFSAPHYRNESVAEMLFGIETSEGVTVGALEDAHGGTIYVDEIHLWPSDVQQKFLKFLVDHKFYRENGENPVHVDVRVLASSSTSVHQVDAFEGNFKDLFHRLSVVQLNFPSLSDRREDIPLLVSNFIAEIAAQLNMNLRSADPVAMAILQAHNWPGNVRQLRNCIEHMMILAHERGVDSLTVDLLPKDVYSDGDGVMATPASGRVVALPLREAREVFEREYLEAQIQRFGGNISRTAEFVGMERSALHRKLKSLGVNATERQEKADQVAT